MPEQSADARLHWGPLATHAAVAALPHLSLLFGRRIRQVSPFTHAVKSSSQKHTQGPPVPSTSCCKHQSSQLMHGRTRGQQPHMPPLQQIAAAWTKRVVLFTQRLKLSRYEQAQSPHSHSVSYHKCQCAQQMSSCTGGHEATHAAFAAHCSCLDKHRLPVTFTLH